MKKAKRIVALLLAAVLCLSLAGCRELEEAKANHAFWNADGSIQWNQFTYRQLPACDELVPQMGDLPTVYVTDAGVPVLLREMYGQWMDRSEDGVFLLLKSGEVFCRGDKYDSIAARIEKGFTPTCYMYEYYGYDAKADDYIDHQYILTAAQQKAVDTIFDTVEPIKLPEGAEMYNEYFMNVYACSEDLLFRRDAFEIQMMGEGYCLLEYETGSLYEVPATYKSTIAAIIAPYVESEQQFAAEMGFEEEDEAADSL